MRRRSGLALIAAVLLATGPAGLADRAELRGFVGSYAWTRRDPGFGGFSGLEIVDDGQGILALSDRGAIIRGVLHRDDRGRISGVDATPPAALAWPAGPVPEDFRFDTEGLALAPDGTLYVSCEHLTRVLRYGDARSVPTVLPVPREFTAMGRNTGLESLAIAADGTLYTMPEETLRPDGTTPVYRFRGGTWDVPFRLTGDPGFLPVGSDIGPDGQLYLLERRFLGLRGFASRVRRIPLGAGDVAAGGVLEGEVLLETPPGYFGNLEGIAVWRDGPHSLRLTMVSDDNFLTVLGTQIVEFRVPG